MNDRLFLTEEEVATLTGIRSGKMGKPRATRQVEWLRTSGIPFTVNAAGRPIITVAAVEGRNSQPQQPRKWQPAIVGG